MVSGWGFFRLVNEVLLTWTFAGRQVRLLLWRLLFNFGEQQGKHGWGAGNVLALIYKLLLP